jgi:hypothetical protein
MADEIICSPKSGSGSAAFPFALETRGMGMRR